MLAPALSGQYLATGERRRFKHPLTADSGLAVGLLADPLGTRRRYEADLFVLTHSVDSSDLLSSSVYCGAFTKTGECAIRNSAGVPPAVAKAPAGACIEKRRVHLPAKKAIEGRGEIGECGRYAAARGVPHARGGRAGSYEVFRLAWHAPWVVCTLPQVSAMVSKTRS